MIEIVDHRVDRHLAMNAMFEDEHSQLNEGSQVHVMKKQGEKYLVMDEFDEKSHSNMEEI